MRAHIQTDSATTNLCNPSVMLLDNADKHWIMTLFLTAIRTDCRHVSVLLNISQSSHMIYTDIKPISINKSCFFVIICQNFVKEQQSHICKFFCQPQTEIANIT